MNEYSKRMDRRSTITRQQEQNKVVVDQENHYHNNYNYHTEPGVSAVELPGEEVMEQIAEAYRANIGPMITQAAALVIENALRGGMEPATVILGIEETGLASRPSPYYLRAVLRNWAERGVVTSRTRERWSRTEGRPWWR